MDCGEHFAGCPGSDENQKATVDVAVVIVAMVVCEAPQQPWAPSLGSHSENLAP